jgi:hypothetical protein
MNGPIIINDGIANGTIPGSPANLQLGIAASGTINHNLFAGILIDHTWQGNLVIRLIHVDTGTAATLIWRPGQSAFNVMGTSAFGFNTDNFGSFMTFMYFFDGAANNPYTSLAFGGSGTAMNNPVGNWRPASISVGGLSVFNGESIAGTWRLTAQDWAPVDTGVIIALQIGLIPLPDCPPDVTGNGVVNIDDLLAVINAWGPCPAPPAPCPADIAPPGGNGTVNIDDLLAVINGWGACP